MKKLGIILLCLTIVTGCKHNESETKEPMVVVKEHPKVVFGCYPYHKKDLYKQLDMAFFTDIAYYSYDLNPNDGTSLSIHDWESTALIDTLKAKGIRSFLAVTNIGVANNKKLLGNSNAIETLTNHIIRLIKMRDADGVCINFEEVSKLNKNNYSKFITLLSRKLKQNNNEYLLYITVPYIDKNKSLDFSALNQVVDHFVIFELETELKETSNYKGSIEYYLSNKIPSTKLSVANAL
jgi:spore germination protein YaaH